MIRMGLIPFSVPSIDNRDYKGRTVRPLVVQVSVIRTPSSIIVYIRGHKLTVDDVGRNALLIRAYGCDDAKRTCCS